MVVALVVAMAKNHVIGKEGGLPWHIPGDLKLFKQTTMGKPIIMGRKTWQSLGHPLPGRPNIVITRDPAYKVEGASVVNDLDQALALAGKMAADLQVEEIMVIGGAEIYRLALPKADRLYLTEVDLLPEGDAFFPDLDQAQWQETSCTAFAAQDDSPAYTLVVYDRAG
jgi:dihydrofolate reductase